MYRAVDQWGRIIDVYVSKRRNLTAARTFFTMVSADHERPAEVTTDLAPSLLRVVDELIPDALHDTDQYANNRIENDHSASKPSTGDYASLQHSTNSPKRSNRALTPHR